MSEENPKVSKQKGRLYTNAKDIPLSERQAVSPQEKIRLLEKYIGDLTYKAPEVFPDGRSVMEQVGTILGMW